MERIKLVDKNKTLKLFKKYMLQNKPCLFENSFTKLWKINELWLKSDGSLNLDYLLNMYETFKCPVIVDENTSQCEEMTFREYIEKYIFNKKKGYLKDWHFQNLCHNNGLSQVYELFSILKFDWINNEEWTSSKNNPFGEDYRFLYFGPEGTWTKFHCDVMGSYSWSANIVGKKIWYFVPIGNEKYFLDKKCGNNNYINDIRERKDIWKESGVFEVTQNPGEVIFVPSGMWHQVHNMVS